MRIKGANMRNKKNIWFHKISGNIFAGLTGLINNEIIIYEKMRDSMPNNLQTELRCVMEQADGYITNLRFLRDIGLNKCSLIHTKDIDDSESEQKELKKWECLIL